jgi:hypothetical protein
MRQADGGYVMGSGMRVDIKGTLGKFGYSNIPDEISDAILVSVVDHAHYTAIKKAPYLADDPPLHLREEIQKEIDLKAKVGYVFIKTSDIPYALIAEYGSKKRLAHPYMRPAAAAARAKMKAIIRTAAKQSIAEEMAKNGNS